LILAAHAIRRSRKVVLTEQARQAHLSPSSRRRKEEPMREAYHRVALQSAREARDRAQAAAKEAIRLYS
jgi:hypothetical protein